MAGPSWLPCIVFTVQSTWNAAEPLFAAAGAQGKWHMQILGWQNLMEIDKILNHNNIPIFRDANRIYICKFTWNRTELQCLHFEHAKRVCHLVNLSQCSSKNPIPESMSSIARSSISKLTAVIPCCLNVCRKHVWCLKASNIGRAACLRDSQVNWLTCKAMEMFGGTTI